MPGDNETYSYDAIPYFARSYPQSHPDRLATIAHLFALEAPPLTRCRVLELGCAGGDNLIPMATMLPESEFVGVELSARQVAEGNAAIAALGLKNVTLEHIDIRAVDDSFGMFDYIIAHGIYSWVPEHVQDHMLTICQRNLAPTGVAYISYNTNPGWRVFGLLRDILLYHARHSVEPVERLERSMQMLDFLHRATEDHPKIDPALATSVRIFAEKLTSLGPDGGTYMAHELIEDFNAPLYFWEFMDRASKHGLQFLAEAALTDLMVHHLPQSLAEEIERTSADLIEAEQYRDFMRGRAFRQTLLCHADVPLDRHLMPARLGGLQVTSRAVPESDTPDISSVSVERFRGNDNAGLATDHPPSKAALIHLRDMWPQAVPFDTLLDTAYARLGTDPGAEERARDREVLGNNLLRAYCYAETLVSLHVHAPPAARAVSTRPVAAPAARLQALRQSEVTNLRHEVVALDPPTTYLLPLLDGTRDRAALRAALATLVAEGNLKVRAGEPPPSGAALESLVEAEVDEVLAFLTYSALLVG